MRPRILESLPKDTKDWVKSRALQGQVDPSNILIYHVFKSFAPGSADEKVQLHDSIINPHVCSNPKAAHNELLRWKASLRRMDELGCAPPDLMMAYRALESIFLFEIEWVDCFCPEIRIDEAGAIKMVP